MKLVVFDLDGTLIDSRLDIANSTNDVLVSFGADPLPIDEVAAMVGDGAQMLVRRAMRAIGREFVPEALDRFRDIYDRRLLEHTRAYDGIAALLESIAPVASLAVLSNKPEMPSRRLLEALGLATHLREVVGGDTPGFARKPDPGGLLYLIAGAAAAPRTTMMVGDSMIDVETARRAGARLCVARYGFGHLRGGLTLRPDEPSVASVDELRDVIATFLR